MSEPAPARRSDAVDIARTVALVAMAGYHLVWDLTDNDFLPPDVPFTPPMRFASHAIATVFLGLVGLSLMLAHRQGPRWGSFLRRIGVVAAAAGLVTIATWFVEPQAPVGFGILHCIAVASLFSAPLLVLPAFVAIILGAAAIIAPSYISSPLFDPPWLIWIGLATHEPYTVDWRPLLPYGGIVWLSLGLVRSLPQSLFASPRFAWRAVSAPGRAAAWLGRHSLAFYLIHQPILFALVFGAANMFGVAGSRERDAMFAQCRPACIEAGGAPETCDRACRCIALRSYQKGIGRTGSSRNDAQELASSCVVDGK